MECVGGWVHLGPAERYWINWRELVDEVKPVG